ncbi:MAG: hypothetical protein PT954_10365, partial [Eubacteriales bacterium]|nr:hypothetical protein [Eubacteriales bacterium]
GEVLERDRGSKSPVSFQPPPRGANKIYKCDAVFRIEKSQYKRPKQNVDSLYAPARSNKIYKCDAVFRIEKSQSKRHKPNAVSLENNKKSNQQK